MQQIRFTVNLTTKELFLFSMRHTYVSMSGVVGLLISIGSFIICACKYRTLDTTAIIALLIIGCLFTIVQPLMLYSKAKAQKKQNEDINDTLNYILDDQGITVSQEDQVAHIKWYEIRRKVQTKFAIYLYMSPVRAFIFPKAQLGEQYESSCEFITSQMNKYKDYEPEQEETPDDGKDGE